jgi:2-dehydropantoate 2-reductase
VRHAILGAGGIGGLLGAALARAGADVVLLVRPETLARQPDRIDVESAVLGNFDAYVPAASLLDRQVDALWVTVKATELESALALAPPDSVGTAAVIPLLNGVDHLTELQARYTTVIAAAIRVESERLAPGQIRQTSPFLRIELAGGEELASELRSAGIECRVREDGLSLLWDKLVFLAPLALATTALDGPLGTVRHDPRYQSCQQEALAVARAEGAQIDEQALRQLADSAPDQMRSSMQKDIAAGRTPELDAIAGPIQRGGHHHSIPTPATDELAHLVALHAT